MQVLFVCLFALLLAVTQVKADAPASQVVNLLQQDPLFDLSSNMHLGPEIQSVEVNSPIYDGLRHTLVQDVATFTSSSPASVSGDDRMVSFRSVSLSDKSKCGDDIHKYCRHHHDDQNWSGLAVCLHALYHRNSDSIDVYNKDMLEMNHRFHESTHEYTPISDIDDLPRLSSSCAALARTSVTIQCIHQLQDHCEVLTSPLQLYSCIVSQHDSFVHSCAPFVKTMGGIQARAATEHHGAVVADANTNTIATGDKTVRSAKDDKEHGVWYYFETHPMICYSLIVLVSLLVALLWFLCFADVSEFSDLRDYIPCMKKKRQMSFAGRLMIPEKDDDYQDDFTSNHYDL